MIQTSPFFALKAVQVHVARDAEGARDVARGDDHLRLRFVVIRLLLEDDGSDGRGDPHGIGHDGGRPIGIGPDERVFEGSTEHAPAGEVQSRDRMAPIGLASGARSVTARRSTGRPSTFAPASPEVPGRGRGRSA